jgi:Flp pilus assembly protein TadD
MTIQEAMQIAIQSHQNGDLARAEAIYRQILTTVPNQPDALHLLGMVAVQNGKYREAVNLIGQAVRLVPNIAVFQIHFGMALAGDGQWEAAIAAFRRTVSLDPKAADGWARLGDALCEMGQLAEAETAVTKALELAVDSAEPHSTMGKVMYGKGNLVEAHRSFRQAVAISPEFAVGCNSLGQTLKELGHLDEAMFWCRRAVELSPNYAEAHWNIGLMLLLSGDLENGWPEFEWRWRMPKFLMPYNKPWWDGSELNGQRLLLHAEQGIGDTIQYIRYLPLVAQRAKRIVVAVQPALAKLARGQSSEVQWVTWGDPLPEYDLHCPLLSLPGLMKTTLNDIPADVPYIRPSAAAVEKWRGRMVADGRKKVGLVWAGGVNPPGRSVPLAMLAELAGPKVWFCSLQKGEAAAQRLGAPFEMADWTDEIKDFADTAALIANLDLVISVDTAVAHLAGAMGKPVWVLLKKSPDWRWMLDRADSPWYPTMRLFRQQALDDWSAPISQIAQALASL